MGSSRRCVCCARKAYSQFSPACEPANPEASPLRADHLQGVAEALVLSCGLDPLMSQAEDYVRRLGQAGVRARHIRYPSLIHGAYRMPGVLPGARRMLEDTASALVSALGGPS